MTDHLGFPTQTQYQGMNNHIIKYVEASRLLMRFKKSGFKIQLNNKIGKVIIDKTLVWSPDMGNKQNKKNNAIKTGIDFLPVSQNFIAMNQPTPKTDQIIP